MSPRTSSVLREHGYDGGSEAWLGHKEMLEPAQAAQAITTGLCEGLDVDTSTARRVLVSDLIHRTAWTRAMIRDLLADGMPEDQLEFGLRWTFLWRSISVDPEIVEVERQMWAEWQSRLRGAEGDWQGSFEREASLNERRNERVKALLAERRDETFDVPQRVREVAKGIDGLKRIRKLALLVERYERLDTATEEIEDILDEAAIGWDRWVQEETDRLRGK